MPNPQPVQTVSPLFPSLSFQAVMAKVDALAGRVPWWLWFVGGIGAAIAFSRFRKKAGSALSSAFGPRPHTS